MAQKIDLSKCKKGDILISSQGSKLEYISPTPWKYYNYLEHVVRYIEDKEGNSYGDENYGTRTNDGFVYKKNRKPETDHDIVQVVPLNSERTVDGINQSSLETVTNRPDLTELWFLTNGKKHQGIITEQEANEIYNALNTLEKHGLCELKFGI